MQQINKIQTELSLSLESNLVNLLYPSDPGIRQN